MNRPNTPNTENLTTDEPKDSFVLPPVAAPVSQHIFVDAAIERAALMHVAPAFKTLSPEADYKETAQFARLKAFAQELASGFREGRNAQPEQPASLELLFRSRVADLLHLLPYNMEFDERDRATAEKTIADIRAALQSPASPTVAGSVDTDEFRALAQAWSDAAKECWPSKTLDGWNAIIAHINARLASERQEGRRDMHETNITLLGENFKLSEKLARLAPAAPSGEAIGVVELHNEGGSGEFKIIAPIGRPNYDLANWLPVGTKLYTHPAPPSPTAPGLPAQAVPEGFALVPLIPTEAMNDAYNEVVMTGIAGSPAHSSHVWEAMLAANTQKGK